LIALRRATPALAAGSYREVHADDDLLIYERAAGGTRRQVALNLSHRSRRIAWPDAGRIVLSTHLDRRREHLAGTLELRSDEGLVLSPEP
jgi:alpha-glucosidase